jgi:hypothetical protein
MPSMPNNPDELLVVLADAEAKHPTEPFLRSRAMGGGPGQPIQHPGLPQGFRARSDLDVQALEHLGFIHVSGNAGSILTLSAAGRSRANVLRRAASETTGPATTQLDWETEVLPVLEAGRRAFVRADAVSGVTPAEIASERGVAVDDPALERAVYELIEAGYMVRTIDSDVTILPRNVRLTERALQVTAGWPTGTPLDTYDRLLAIVDERLEQAGTPEERTRWQGFRDGLLGLGRDFFVDVTAALAARQLGG